MLIAVPDLENKKNMSSRIVWKVGASKMGGGAPDVEHDEGM